MCGESEHADSRETAIAGVKYHIADGAHLGFNLATLHREGMGRPQGNVLAPIKRAACIEKRTPVILTGIPQYLQMEYKIPSTIKATFVPRKLPLGSQIELSDGRSISLVKFTAPSVRLEVSPPERHQQAQPRNTWHAVEDVLA